jgi:predicted small metal-binding protein
MPAIVTFAWIDHPLGRTLVASSSVARGRTAMRVIDCPCGHVFEAENDEELVRLCYEHVQAEHPEMQRTEDQIRARVAADARDA